MGLRVIDVHLPWSIPVFLTAVPLVGARMEEPVHDYDLQMSRIPPDYLLQYTDEADYFGDDQEGLHHQEPKRIYQLPNATAFDDPCVALPSASSSFVDSSFLLVGDQDEEPDAAELFLDPQSRLDWLHRIIRLPTESGLAKELQRARRASMIFNNYNFAAIDAASEDSLRQGGRMLLKQMGGPDSIIAGQILQGVKKKMAPGELLSSKLGHLKSAWESYDKHLEERIDEVIEVSARSEQQDEASILLDTGKPLQDFPRRLEIFKDSAECRAVIVRLVPVSDENKLNNGKAESHSACTRDGLLLGLGTSLVEELRRARKASVIFNDYLEQAEDPSESGVRVVSLRTGGGAKIDRNANKHLASQIMGMINNINNGGSDVASQLTLKQLSEAWEGHHKAVDAVPRNEGDLNEFCSPRLNTNRNDDDLEALKKDHFHCGTAWRLLASSSRAKTFFANNVPGGSFAGGVFRRSFAGELQVASKAPNIFAMLKPKGGTTAIETTSRWKPPWVWWRLRNEDVYPFEWKTIVEVKNQLNDYGAFNPKKELGELQQAWKFYGRALKAYIVTHPTAAGYHNCVEGEDCRQRNHVPSSANAVFTQSNIELAERLAADALSLLPEVKKRTGRRSSALGDLEAQLEQELKRSATESGRTGEVEAEAGKVDAKREELIQHWREYQKTLATVEKVERETARKQEGMSENHLGTLGWG
ncbi:unnamed protein product [Amoebophrya sp. A25]|nr:unnamed protein product [Amoebophrya sp. A25]|eukprot:GSA25T00004628001.1